MTATIKFDFSHYIPNQDPNATIIKLAQGQCIPNNFVVVTTCANLEPGTEYEISYQLLNPSTNPGNPVNIFDPPVQTLYASFTTQKFATLADLEVQGEYILQATLKNLTTNIQTSSIISLQCGDPAQPTPTPSITPTITPSRFSRQNNVTVSIVDPDFDPIPDNIITLASGVNEFPLVALANNTIIGSRYSYEFFDVPENSLVFEKKSGEFYSGSSTQNFNSKIAFSGLPQYVYVYALVTDAETNVKKYSEPTLFKYQGNHNTFCNAVLPSGLDIRVGAPAFRTCNSRGLTTESISSISGGSGFSIGDTLTTVGGGGFGAELEIVSGGITLDSFSSVSGGTGLNIGDFLEVTGGGGSGGLIQITSGSITKESITQISNSTGFVVGDLLTTTGGGGDGVVIRVTEVDQITGAILDFEVINGGSGFTFAPNGLIALTGTGAVASVTFNDDNFGISSGGGITAESIILSGGSGYAIDEILDINGGGGTGAQVQIISGSLTTLSFNGISGITGGTGYSAGDYLTTTGGGGEGVVIKVLTVGANGEIATWELVNGGYGFTGAPTGVVSLTGTGIGAVVTANDTNFAVQTSGQITQDSIDGLVNSGLGYSVGDRLIVSGGGGSGGLIEITSVGANGAILSYVIIDGGFGYSSAPIILDEDGDAIDNQPSWNIDDFTDSGFIIINAGSGYFDKPTVITSANGDGSGLVFDFVVENFTDPSFIVVNSGSGYTSAPTGLVAVSGDGQGFTATFNDTNFTIPSTGGLTPESIQLSGGTGYNIGEQISVNGGGGTGGIVQIISGSLTEASFTSLFGGSGYAVGDYLTTTGGEGDGVVILVTGTGANGAITSWQLISGGYGFTSEPTGLVSITGSGSNAVFVANDDNFTITSENGLTQEAINIAGGTGFDIGEVLTITGGDSTAEIVVISGSLSEQSIASLTGGSNYVVGDLLTTVGGGGEDVVIRVTSVDANGSITGWEILNAGYGFTDAPTGLVSLTGSGTNATFVANNNNFALTSEGGVTKDSLADLLGASNDPPYTANTQIYVTGGGGAGAIIRVLSVDQNGNIVDFVVTDAGSGYDGSSDFVLRTSSISGPVIDTEITVVLEELTDSSVIILNQGSGFDTGTAVISGSTGNGAGSVLTIESDMLTDRAFVIVDSGSGYTSEPTSLTSISGNGSGIVAVFDVEEFSEPAIIVTNPGSGYQDSPTGLSVLTGYGVIETVEVEFNDVNFVEITGTLPTPTVTPTVTPTPSITPPAPCNDLQTAGGQNDIYLIKVARSANSSQNFLIVEDSPALQLSAVLVLDTFIDSDTSITKIENYYSSVSDEANLKRITLSKPTLTAISTENTITAYTVDIRIIKTSYRPGMMNFIYDAYTVPDRFQVVGIPVDSRLPEVLLFDSGFRGDITCGYATTLAGVGSGSVEIFKPDGMIYIKVLVEAPCDGTAWKYLLTCPVDVPLISITPTNTPTTTPSS